MTSVSLYFGTHFRLFFTSQQCTSHHLSIDTVEGRGHARGKAWGGWVGDVGRGRGERGP